MIAYGAGEGTTKDMIRVGLPLAVIMYGLIVVCMFTYWPLVGLWKSGRHPKRRCTKLFLKRDSILTGACEGISSG